MNSTSENDNVILEASGEVFRVFRLSFWVCGYYGRFGEAGDTYVQRRPCIHRHVFQKHGNNLHDELVSGDDVFLLHNIKSEKCSSIKWLESGEATVKTCCFNNGAFLRQRARWI